MESFGEVARWLRSRGFKRVRAKNRDTFSFRGDIQCHGKLVCIRIEISDWDFVSYPKVFLESIPESLAGFRPHVLSSGDLCYYLKGAIVLNRYQPVAAVARCLKKAEETIESLSGESSFSFDEHDEFGLYWAEALMHVGDLSVEKKRAILIYIKDAERAIYVLTQDDNESRWLAKAMGVKHEEKSNIPVWFLHTDQHPVVSPKEGLPGTIKATMNWIKNWDTLLFQRLTSLLETRQYLEHPVVAFVVSSPVGLFGFILKLDPSRRNLLRRKPARYRQYLYGKGQHTPIIRVFGVDVAPSFVHTRNIQGQSLLGRKVTVVGCGAVGGYVAHALVRLGAGIGKQGRLTLIDVERIEGGNLGRHVLGFSSLALNKAIALGRELEGQFPYANIRMIDQDVRRIHRLSDDEIVIDTTGEEALSIAISRAHQVHLLKGRECALLHVWVTGNGEVVQCLLVDNSDVGCFRCLWTEDPKSGMRDRFRVLKKDPNTRFIGCQSVTMFPVSAGMSAAALAADVVIDWLGGNPTPRFRTRTREGADVFGVKNQDLTKLDGCPGCTTT